MLDIINSWILSIEWNAVSGIASVLGVLITTILTYIIIKQTRILSEQQSKLESRINKEQNDLIRRQLKVEAFPYKRNLYLNLFKVLEFSHFLEETILTLDLTQKSSKDILGMYKMSIETYITKEKEIIDSLREAKYILPDNISPTVAMIEKMFDQICVSFSVIGTFNDFFTVEEYTQIKKYNIDLITENVKGINEKVGFIQSIMPKELDISRIAD